MCKTSLGNSVSLDLGPDVLPTPAAEDEAVGRLCMLLFSAGLMSFCAAQSSRCVLGTTHAPSTLLSVVGFAVIVERAYGTSENLNHSKEQRASRTILKGTQLNIGGGGGKNLNLGGRWRPPGRRHGI